MQSEPFDYLPLWGVFGATVGLALLAVVAGYFLGNRLGGEEVKKKAPVGELVGAMLTLASLLLAFTFGWAQSHFDARRDLVLDEANAIGTTWLRARLVPEPHRSEVRKLLREYTEVRVGAVQSGRTRQTQKLQQAVAHSEELHNQLWTEAAMIGEKDPQSEMAALFVGSLNQVIDFTPNEFTSACGPALRQTSGRHSTGLLFSPLA